MFILCHDRTRTKALNSPDFREALKYLRQLETESINAANKHWKFADAVDAVYHTYGEPAFSAAFALMLALLPARKTAQTAAAAAETSRYRRGLRAIGRTLASGAVAGVVMFGLAVAMPTGVVVAAAPSPETSTVPDPNPEEAKRQLAQLAAVIRAWLGELDAFARPIAPAGCPAP